MITHSVAYSTEIHPSQLWRPEVLDRSVTLGQNQGVSRSFPSRGSGGESPPVPGVYQQSLV